MKITAPGGTAGLATSPTGPAGGDLGGGGYPAPDVIGINGIPIETGAITDGDILRYDAGTGTWLLVPPPSVSPSGAAGGDLSGTYPNPTVAKVNGTSVPASPTAGQILAATSSTAAAWRAPFAPLSASDGSGGWVLVFTPAGDAIMV